MCWMGYMLEYIKYVWLIMTQCTFNFHHCQESLYNYTVSTKKRPPPFYFSNNFVKKINQFRCFLVWEFLRQFDINSLYTCPPYLYTVTTLPWGNPKQSFFNSIIHNKYLKYVWIILLKMTFGFPKVKWLQYTGKVGKCTSYRCQIFSGFSIPKIIKIG